MGGFAMIKDTQNDKSARTSKTKKTSRGYEGPPFDWITDANNPVRAERSIWIAVITQAMMDALSRSQKPEEQFHKFEATRWLTDNSQDFRNVCSLADLDPDYVRLKAKKALATGGLWRAEAGTGKRYEERKAYREREKKQHKTSAPEAQKNTAHPMAENITA